MIKPAALAAGSLVSWAGNVRARRPVSEPPEKIAADLCHAAGRL
jgi:hypothetical protein